MRVETTHRMEGEHWDTAVDRVFTNVNGISYGYAKTEKSLFIYLGSGETYVINLKDILAFDVYYTI